MKKLMMAAVAAVAAAGAAAFDLDGVDRLVTSLDDYPDGFTNSSATLARLIVSNDTDLACSVPIGGNLKLVKRGMRDLSIGTANSFTGGTEIYSGRILVKHQAALGTGEVYVENDCARPVSCSDMTNLSALAVFCSISNDLRFSSWSAELPAVDNCQENYNLQSAATGQWLYLYGKVTGGSISLDTSNQRCRWGNSWENGSQFTVFASTVDCTGGTIYMHARNVVQFRGQAKAALVTTFAHNDYGHFVGFWPKGNDVREYRIAGDNAISYGSDCWKSTVFVTTNYIGKSAYGSAEYGSVSMDNRNQVIDRLTRGVTQGTRNAWYPRRVYSNGNESMSALTFTMEATGDSECDFAFDNNVTVKWAPKGDYTMRCVGDRISRTTGRIVVDGGKFEVTGAATFSNVTAIAVGDGAKFANAGTAPGAFWSVAEVSAGAGASLDMGGVAAWTPGQVKLTAAADAKVALPTDGVLEVLTLTVGGVQLPCGTFDRSTCPCLVGEGKVKVLTDTATWTAGASPDDGIETVANWTDPERVVGNFRNGALEAKFADAGSRAVVSDRDLFHGIAVNRSFTFAKGGDAAEIGAASGGVTLTGANTTIFEPPFLVGATQTWSVAAGHTLVVTGGLTQAANAPAKLTVKGTGSGIVSLYGRGDASTFAGPVDIRGKVSAEGDDPFGRAADGTDGTVTLFSGGDQAPCLELGTCRITKPFKTSGTWSNADYFRTKFSNWDKPSGYYTATFEGPVDIGADTSFRLNGWKSAVVFAGGGRFLATLRSYGGDFTVTNAPLTFSLKDSPQTTVNYHLYVASNRVDAVTPNAYFYNMDFGADWALYEGNTEVRLWYHDNNGSIGGTTIDLAGHPQRIGSLSSRLGKIKLTNPSTKVVTEGDPFSVTPAGRCQIKSAAAATLYVNQTEDKTTLAPFTGKAALWKYGPARLVMTNTASTAQAPLTVAGGTLKLIDAPWKNATNVTVVAASCNATLWLSTTTAAPDVPQDKFFTRKGFNLTMTDGRGKALLILDEGVCETAYTFVLNGRQMPGGCTYGSSRSPATVKDDVHFAGKGVVKVVHPSGCLVIVR